MEMAQEIVSKGFNPRSPCGERRFDSREKWSRAMFQPTLPLRGATAGHYADHHFTFGFNPRSPCGERPSRHITVSRKSEFQPTLPLRGATCKPECFTVAGDGFQPTLPLRGATI